MTMASPDLTFRQVDTSNWADLERLFESRGGPKHCWCMLWRTGAGKHMSNQEKKQTLQARVQEGTPIGLIGYAGREPVAWCSVAPRSSYRPLGGPDDDGKSGAVWSIVCFFVTREFRRRGLVGELIAAAARYAVENGAAVLEAYPVDPESPSYRFMGFVPSFEEAGFVEVGRIGKRRHVMRRSLGERGVQVAVYGKRRHPF